MAITLVVTGCANKDQYLSDVKYCTRDSDCVVSCCQSCNNSYWTKENVPADMECCSGPPIDGCQCVNNQCVPQ